ncbi:hypothetical protein FRB95_012193 [Tulasnella sp. JGI-2019a]|nr:hypothetical protein FRB95_012193 [Tulasnella sp. JGI-2019a]
MMGAIVLLRETISVAMMEWLLGLSVGDGSRALHHLPSVISIPGSPNESPRIHHTSFRDFITDPLRCTETEFCIQPGIQGARLAARCLELTTFAAESGVMRQALEPLGLLKQREQWGQWEQWELQEKPEQSGQLEQLGRRLGRLGLQGLQEVGQMGLRGLQQLGMHGHPLEQLQGWLERLQEQQRLERLELPELLERREQSKEPEELEYALSWWWYHLSQAGSYEDQAMALVEVSTSRCLMWWFGAICPGRPTTGLTEASSWAALSRVRSLASMTAALALNAGHPRKAVEVIEHARGFSFTQLQEYQTTLDKLLAYNPGLSSELLQLSFELSRFVSLDVNSDMVNSVAKLEPDAVRSHRELSKRWNDVLARIWELPGFGAFLKPAPFDILQRAATEGPVIIVNITQLRSDAIIILKVRDPVVIPLPRATPSAIQTYTERSGGL